MPHILRIRGWQIELFIFALIPIVGIIDLVVIYFWPYPWVSILFSLVGLSFMLSYPLLIWYHLDRLLAGQPRFERTSKRTVIILVIGCMSLLLLPIADYEPLRLPVIVIYLSSHVYLTSLPGKQLKSIELKRNAGIWEYVPEAFQFFIWPLAVLWLQPRINETLESRIIIEE